MKVSELQGARLDYYVAKAEGQKCKIDKVIAGLNHGQIACQVWVEPTENMHGYNVEYCPSSDWLQGGPLLDREIRDMHCDGGKMKATTHNGVPSWGATYLEAACRAIVASKFGHEVPDLPEE